MPANTSKRARTESTRKRQGRENAEAVQRQATTKKSDTKARKDRRDEAKQDDLLVEREGESNEMSELRALNLQLASDIQRMRAQLTSRNKEDHLKPPKIIPEPSKLSEVDIKDVRRHLMLTGEGNDVEWFGLRTNTRDLLNSAGLDQRKRWAKQDLGRQGTIVHALENRHPRLKDFENHWGALYLLRECHNNIFNYRAKRGDAHSTGDSNTSSDTPLNPLPPTTSQPLNTQEPVSDDDEDTRARKAVLRKAALTRSVERKAAKLRARAELEAELATNDGETEPEELSEEVRRWVEQEEIGIPADSDVLLKPVPKNKRRRIHKDNTPGPSKSTGGKRVSGNRRASRTAIVDPEDDELSVSSGQTSCGSDDD